LRKDAESKLQDYNVSPAEQTGQTVVLSTSHAKHKINYKKIQMQRQRLRRVKEGGACCESEGQSTGDVSVYVHMLAPPL